MTQEEKVKYWFKRMSKGAMQSNYTVAYEGFKELACIGEPVVPYLLEVLSDIDYSNTRFRALTHYIAAVFSLLHEINESEADKVKDSIISQGCPIYISSLLKAITSYSVKNYKKSEVMGIAVYEHMKLKSQCAVIPQIEKWLLNVPEKDLEKLDRIYIVRNEDIDNSTLGTYTPILNCVSLRWNNNYKETSLMFKISLLGVEKVFYHEIGHHVHRHTFGQDPIQEKEADNYAYKILKLSHINLDRAAKFISSFTEDHENKWKKGLIAIELSDKETGEIIGTIKENDMQFLLDHLVKEYADDTDFYINQSTVELLSKAGTNTKIANLIKKALGTRTEMEIEWSAIYD